MKKFMSLIAVAFFATASFAQEMKKDSKAGSTTPVQATHECYMMKDGALMHHMGDKTEPLKTDIKLKNGTKLSMAGLMTTSDGTQTKLENGECVSLMGGVGDCDKMHSMDNK